VRPLLETLEDRFSPAVLLSTWSGLSFEQLVNKSGGPRTLADTNVAAGNYFVAVAGNDGVTFINKVTAQVRLTETFESMFGQPAAGGYLDPTVNFDPQYKGQFVLTTLNGADTSNSVLDFALIPDSDPASFQYAQYTLNNVVSPSPYGDFDHVGWNNDAYFIAMNMPSSTWDGSYVLTVPKVDVHVSPPPPPNAVQPPVRLPDYESDQSLNFLNYCVQPAIMHDGPSGQMWFVATPVPVADYGNLSSEPDDANVASTNVMVIGLTYSTLQSITTSSFHPYPVTLPSSLWFYPTPADGVAQPGGTGINLDVNDTRMLKAEWQNNRLVCTNTVGLVPAPPGATDSAVGWYEFSTANPDAPSFSQGGFIQGPAGTSTFYPAIAIAPDGDLGMTYLECSATEPLSIFVTGQPLSQYQVPNALGYDKMEQPQLVVSSIGPYTLQDVVGQDLRHARLGDFSNVTADPETGDFWAANEWTDEGDGTLQNGIWVGPQQSDCWDTEVAHFSLFPSVSATQNAAGVAVGFIISANDGTLWEYDPTFPPSQGANPYCRQISTGQFSAISATRDASGNPVVFAIISGTQVAGVASPNQTLWEYDPAFPGSHWVEVSSNAFGSISATHDPQGNPVVFATWAVQRDPGTGEPTTYSQTLWEYDDNSTPGNGTWTFLSGSPWTWASISATQDALGNAVVFAISAPTDGSMTQTLWEYDPAFQWACWSTQPFASISATRDGLSRPVLFGVVLGLTPAYSSSVWEWTAATNTWTNVSASSGSQFVTISATQSGPGNAPVLFAIVFGMQSQQDPSGQALDYYNGTWTPISISQNASLSATRDALGNEVVFGVLTDQLVWEYDLAFGQPYWISVWQQQWS
jgi:hypothetical protein